MAEKNCPRFELLILPYSINILFFYVWFICVSGCIYVRKQNINNSLYFLKIYNKQVNTYRMPVKYKLLNDLVFRRILIKWLITSTSFGVWVLQFMHTNIRSSCAARISFGFWSHISSRVATTSRTCIWEDKENTL